MKRWWVMIALLLSLGFNLGLLAALAGGWLADRAAETGDPEGAVEIPVEIPLEIAEGGEAEGWDGPPRGPLGGVREGAGPPLDRMADHLGLEGETREQFLALQRRFVHERAEARLRRAAIDRELRRQLTAAEPDAARIEELTAAKAEVFLAAERATARTILETRRLLGAEQQRRYDRVLERMLRGGGPGPGAGPGPRGLRRPGGLP